MQDINYIYAIPCPTGPRKFQVVVLVKERYDGHGNKKLAKQKIQIGSTGFFDCPRSGRGHSASFNMQKKHGGSIRSDGYYLQRCARNTLTQCSFSVTESRVSGNCTRNIHRLSTPEKEVN